MLFSHAKPSRNAVGRFFVPTLQEMEGRKMSSHESVSAMPSLRPGAYAPILKQSGIDHMLLCEICGEGNRFVRVPVAICGTTCELDVCSRCAKAAV